MELIRTATADPAGNFCLILETPPASADIPSVIVEYRAGRTEAWRRHQTTADIIDVIWADGDAPGQTVFIAITGAGDVIEISDRIVAGRIAGSGFSDPDSRNLGRLTRLQRVAGEVLALGFGGQAYRRRAPGDWIPVAQPFPVPPVPSDTYKLIAADVAPHLGALAFGGVLVTGIGDNAEIDAANDADDADLLVELLLQETRPDSGTVLILKNNEWSVIDLPFSGEVDGLVTDQSGDLYLWVRDGLIYWTRDFTDMLEIVFEATDTGISALETYKGAALAATETALLALGPGGAEPFDPPPPASKGNVIELAGEGEDLFLFRSASILRRENGTWVEVTVPAGIASLG